MIRRRRGAIGATLRCGSARDQARSTVRSSRCALALVPGLAPLAPGDASAAARLEQHAGLAAGAPNNRLPRMRSQGPITAGALTIPHRTQDNSLLGRFVHVSTHRPNRAPSRTCTFTRAAPLFATYTAEPAPWLFGEALWRFGRLARAASGRRHALDVVQRATLAVRANGLSASPGQSRPGEATSRDAHQQGGSTASAPARCRHTLSHNPAIEQGHGKHVPRSNATSPGSAECWCSRCP